MKLLYLIKGDTFEDKAFAYRGFFYFKYRVKTIRCGRETANFPYCNEFKLTKLNQVLTQEFLDNQ